MTRRRYRLELSVGALVGLVSAALTILLLWPAHRVPTSPLVRYAPCHEIVLGQEWGCSSGPDGRPHAFVRDGDGYVDAGELSPIPPVPRG